MSQTLQFAQDLARLRQEGRGLRRRIEASGRLKTVLVADEDPFLRALFVATLSPESYEMREAGTGTSTPAMVHEYHPSLVILDAQMPEPEGVTVCATIKAGPALRDIRVVMVTGDQRDQPRAREAGADRYLSKPFSPLDLLRTIEALLLNNQGN